MKEVKLKGGLGNQLFQYAFAKKLEFELKEPIFLDSSIYFKFKDRKLEINKFNIKIPQISNNRIIKKLKFGTFLYKLYIFLNICFNRKYLFERKTKIKNMKKYNYFDGYWQNLYYLNNIENDLRKDISLINDNLKNEIRKKNSVAVGFRKGDYLKKENLKRFGVCDNEYYKKAIEIIKNKVKDPVFYIFSDDILLVKQEIENIFSKEDRIIYANETKKYSPAEELILMSKCEHAIIPNSTFSWWGAWLIENKSKIVVVPKYWYIDGTITKIIPKEWIKIENKNK